MQSALDTRGQIPPSHRPLQSDNVTALIKGRFYDSRKTDGYTVATEYNAAHAAKAKRHAKGNDGANEQSSKADGETIAKSRAKGKRKLSAKAKGKQREKAPGDDDSADDEGADGDNESEGEFMTMKYKDFTDVAEFDQWWPTVTPEARAEMKRALPNLIAAGNKFFNSSKAASLKDWKTFQHRNDDLLDNPTFALLLRTHLPAASMRSRGQTNLLTQLLPALQLEPWIYKTYRQELLEKNRGAWEMRRMLTGLLTSYVFQTVRI